MKSILLALILCTSGFGCVGSLVLSRVTLLSHSRRLPYEETAKYFWPPERIENLKSVFNYLRLHEDVWDDIIKRPDLFTTYMKAHLNISQSEWDEISPQVNLDLGLIDHPYSSPDNRFGRRSNIYFKSDLTGNTLFMRMGTAEWPTGGSNTREKINTILSRRVIHLIEAASSLRLTHIAFDDTSHLQGLLFAKVGYEPRH